ncbi:MAG: DNA-3-methyladenine glycosylase I [Promethearchaeota archaeon]
MSQHDWACKRGELPTEDSIYFANMTRVIFQAGLNWKVITSKWPDFQDAFANFDLEKVAKFTEADIHQLMTNKAIVRNEAKIRATINNAEIFKEIAAEADSFRNYLETLLTTQGLDKTTKTLQKRFNRLGKTSSSIFLWSVGVDVPHPD